MVRKRAPGGGRKPRGDIVGKASAFTTRITNETRRALEEAAARSGRSISQEAERRLRASMQKPDCELHNLALAHAVALLAERIERETEQDWRTDAFTGAAMRAAVELLMVRFTAEAQKAPQVPPAIQKMRAKVPPEYAELLAKPGGLGHMRSHHLITEIELAPTLGTRSEIDEWSLPIGLNAPLDRLALLRSDLISNDKGE